MADSGRDVFYNNVIHNYVSVVPALNLNLSDVSFASAAEAASSTGYKENSNMTENTYTLRYPSDGTEKAVISVDGTKVKVTNANNKYLMVQNSAGVYAYAIGSDDTTVNASELTGMALDDFNHCKVWIESTDADRITTAKMATQAVVSPVKINGGTTEKTTYVEGDTVTITANAPASGKQFKEWKVVKGAVTFANSKSATTTFNMPASEVEVEAVYEDIPKPPVTPTTAQPTPTTATTTTPIMMAKASAGNKQVSLKWTKVKNATGYDILGSRCGKNNYRKYKSVKGKTSSTVTKLKKGTAYKFVVKAYKTVNGKKYYLKSSNKMYVITANGKRTNAKKVSTNFTKATLKKGKIKTIRGNVVGMKKGKKVLHHVATLRYFVSNKKVVKVSSRGKIKAVGKGKSYIYVCANNGVYKRLTITVK